MKIFDTKRLRVRKLTPYEYGTLQAFPMETWEQVVSDSQAYKQFGNAVTVTLFEAIAINIKNAILAAEKSEELNMDAAVENKDFGMNPPTEGETEVKADAVAVEAESKEPQAAAVEEKHIETEEEFKKNHAGHVGVEEMADFITETLFNETLIPGALFKKIKDSVMQTLTQEFDGITIGEPKVDARDWEAARRALDDIINKYDPSGHMAKAIFPVLMPLKERLDRGERTPELFNQIVESTR